MERTEDEIATAVLDCAFLVHRETGPGLLESVYEELLALELDQRGVRFDRQHPIPIHYKGSEIPVGFRADILVEKRVLVELKSVEKIHTIHTKQLLTYLKLSGIKLGLLINFNEILLKDGINRIVYGL